MQYDGFFTDATQQYKFGDDPVTFQIALIGCDGLVIGSDSLGTHVGLTQDGTSVFPQRGRQRKYVISDSGSLVCFAAGGYQAPQLAQQIALECDPATETNRPTELKWQDAIRQVACRLDFTYESRDEVLLARRDITDRFWIVRRKITRSLVGEKLAIPAVSVTSAHTCLCTGEMGAAIFFAHFGNGRSSVSELKKLAALALS